MATEQCVSQAWWCWSVERSVIFTSSTEHRPHYRSHFKSNKANSSCTLRSPYTVCFKVTVMDDSVVLLGGLRSVGWWGCEVVTELKYFDTILDHDRRPEKHLSTVNTTFIRGLYLTIGWMSFSTQVACLHMASMSKNYEHTRPTQ